MPFTLAGWTETQDATTTLRYVAAMADEHITVVGDDVKVPALAQLAAHYALGPTMTLAQISSPSLRRRTNLDLGGIDVAAEPLSLPNMSQRFANPLPLEAGEKLNALAAKSGGVAEYAHVLVWLSDGPITPVTGEIFSVRATGATALVAYTWSSSAITFTQTLPTGRYQCVGARAESAGMIAFRLIFPGYSWRPGGVGADAPSDISPNGQRLGGWGVWGEFADDAQPILEALSISADATQTLYLDLIKIA